MAKKNIGATLSIKDNNFTAGIRNAITGVKNLKNHTTNATGGLKKMQSQSKLTGEGLASLAKKAAGVVAAYAGFSQVKAFMSDCVVGVLELERANERLGTLMKNVKGTTQAQVDDIIKYGDALELVTTVEGDATVAGASQLATFQLQSSTIKALLPSLQNLAVGTYGVNVSQEQMIQTGNLVGKVMQGQTGALSRVGVSFSEAQGKILKSGTEAEKTATLIEVLNQNFGGLAENMAKTPEGRIRQLKNAWGSVKDIVGYGVLPVITSAVNFLASKIPDAQNAMTKAVETVKVPIVWIKDNALPPLITAFQNVWNYGVSAFNNIKSAVMENSEKFSGIITIAGGVKDALFNAFEFCKPALNWIKDTGLPLVVNALAGVVQKATDVYNFFVNNWGWIAPVISGIVGAIVAFKVAVFAINTVMNAWAIVRYRSRSLERYNRIFKRCVEYHILRRCFRIYGNRKCSKECVERYRRRYQGRNKQHYFRNKLYDTRRCQRCERTYKRHKFSNRRCRYSGNSHIHRTADSNACKRRFNKDSGYGYSR